MGTKPDIEFAGASAAFLPHMASACSSEVPDFSEILLRSLESFGIQYCLLGPASAEGASESHEIAIGAESRGRLAAVFQKLKDEGFVAVQSRSLAPNDWRYDFATDLNADSRLFCVTFLAPFPEGHSIAVDRRIFARSERRGNYLVACARDEFGFLLWKIAEHGSITEAQRVRTRLLFESLGELEAGIVASKLFGDALKSELLGTCENGNWEAILGHLHDRLKSSNQARSWLESVAYAYLQLQRMLSRWFRPSGIYIVLLGPDGAGKSTLVNNILGRLGPLFDSSRILQWRPQVIKPRSRYSPYFNPPHAKPPHGAIESILRIFAVIFDYWVGYPVVILPMLADSGLIIYDRDFHDLLVDTLRYRYGGPLWLPELAAKLIPHPETIFLTLDAETDVILGRKQEVAPEELRRQRAAYAELAAKLPNSTLIRTDCEGSSAKAMGAILGHLARRFELRTRQGAALNSQEHRLKDVLAAWKVWLVKGFMAVTDQGLISGSNFVLSILLARYLSATQYGTYAVAYSTFVLLSLIHQALVLEPMTVLGPSVYRDSPRKYLSLLTWMQLAFSGVVMVSLGLFGMKSSTLADPAQLKLAFIGMGVASPFVLLFWYARRAYYLHLLPGQAVVGAITYSVFLAAGVGFLYYLRLISAFSTFLAMGAAALVTSILLLLRLRSITTPSAAPAHITPGQVAIHHWRYGGWALVSMIFFWVPWNLFYSLVTRFSGLEGTGTLKALLNLALPMTATYGAFSMLFLPYTARLGAEGGWKAARREAWKIAGLFTLGSGAYWLLVCVFRIQLVHLLYGRQYSEIVPLVPVVAVSSILSGAAMGPTIAIKAMRSPATVAGVYFGATLVSLFVGIPACWAWGYRGAVLAILLSSVTTCVAGILRCSQPKGVRSMRMHPQEDQAAPAFSPATETSGPQELS